MPRTDVTKVKPNLNVKYSAYPTARDFHASTAFVRAILGPIGSGKSSATWMELFRRACDEWPNEEGVRSSMHLCVRDTYAMLKETTLADFKSWFGKVAEVVMDSPIRARVQMPLPDGTTLDWNLRFLSMDGGDKSLNALRGMQISAAYINEGHSIPKEVYEVVATRVGRYRPAGRDPKWKGIITDSNYGYQGCHLHDMYLNTPETWAFFEQPAAALWNPYQNKWELNPNADNLPHLPGGIDYYRKLLTMSTEFIKQFLANQWAVKTTGKQVFPEFSPQEHIIRGSLQPDRHLPLIIGMDFGLHVACSMFQLSPMGKLVMFKELWDDDADLETFLTTRLLPTLRNEFTGIRAIVCGDPAGMGRSHLDKRNAFTVLKAAGLDAHPAITNDPSRRIGAVKQFLTKRNGFSVHHTCKRTIEGFEGGYGYKKKIDGTFSDDPEKNDYSHILDSVQYSCLFARFGAKRDTDPYGQAKQERLQAQARSQRPSDDYFYA